MNLKSTNLSQPVNVVTLKWGTRYGVEFVNKLFKAVSDNLSLPFRFICFTDDDTGLAEGIVPFPIPDIEIDPPALYTGWRKLCLFRPDLPIDGICLFLDLDILITGNIDEFFSFESEKIPIIRDWVALGRKIFPKGLPVGNSSIFRFVANKSSFVYEQFLREREWALSNFQPPQSYLTHCIRPQMAFWPKHWAISFKEHCRPVFPLNYLIEARLPRDARIVVFHGKPDPDEAAYGYRGKKIHHYVRPTRWVRELWEK
jgi:hypothetical protein